MYTRIRLLLLIRPISSFFFLSNFQTLKFFITVFSGTVRPRRLKLSTHVNSGQVYSVYRNQAATSYLSRYFFSFLLSSFQTLKDFVALFSETEAYKVDTWYTHGQCVDVSCVPESGCCRLFGPLFLHFPFSPIIKIYNFRHIFLRNCEA